MIERRVGDYTFRLEYHRDWNHPLPHSITVLFDGHILGEKRFAHPGEAAEDFVQATSELARIIRRERRLRLLSVLGQIVFGAAAGYLLGRPLLDLLSN